jgi:hypothetical protein
MPASENLRQEAHRFAEIALQDCDDQDVIFDFVGGRLYDGPSAYNDCDPEAHAEFMGMSSQERSVLLMAVAAAY